MCIRDRVYTASSLSQAQAIIQSHPIALMISDIEMPQGLSLIHISFNKRCHMVAKAVSDAPIVRTGRQQTINKVFKIMMSVNRVKILTKRPSNENNFCIFFSLCFISISATSSREALRGLRPLSYLLESI